MGTGSSSEEEGKSQCVLDLPEITGKYLKESSTRIRMKASKLDTTWTATDFKGEKVVAAEAFIQAFNQLGIQWLEKAELIGKMWTELITKQTEAEVALELAQSTCVEVGDKWNMLKGDLEIIDCQNRKYGLTCEGVATIPKETEVMIQWTPINYDGVEIDFKRNGIMVAKKEGKFIFYQCGKNEKTESCIEIDEESNWEKCRKALNRKSQKDIIENCPMTKRWVEPIKMMRDGQTLIHGEIEKIERKGKKILANTPILITSSEPIQVVSLGVKATVEQKVSVDQEEVVGTKLNKEERKSLKEKAEERRRDEEEEETFWDIYEEYIVGGLLSLNMMLIMIVGICTCCVTKRNQNKRRRREEQNFRNSKEMLKRRRQERRETY